MSPARFGRYEVRRLLGQGGFGQVFLARDPLLQRDVAVKAPLGAWWTGGEVLQEARALAKLGHPGIVAVLDAGLEGQQAFIVLELVDGGSLESALQRTRKPWEPKDVVELLRVPAEALDHAHARGVLHRDLKPGNLLAPSSVRLAKPDPADPTPRLKVSDLGLASLVARHGPATSRPALGDPRYSAPEAWRGSPVPGSDLFSLACIAFRLMAGEAPLEGPPGELVSQAGQPARRRLREIRPDLPRGLDEAFATALAASPKDRPKTAKALLDLLDEASSERWEVRRVAAEARERIAAREEPPKSQRCPQCLRPLHPRATSCPRCDGA
jgi:eukaryotic-like serine/threonine-protein kinase